MIKLEVFSDPELLQNSLYIIFIPVISKYGTSIHRYLQTTPYLLISLLHNPVCILAFGLP